MTDRMIGFIGLGKMGNPMVRRLAGAGWTVVAYDLDQRAIDALAGVEGVRTAATLSEVAGTGLVVTMLPNGAAVAAVALGSDALPGGLAATMGEGSTLIDMSSSAPWETTALGEQLAARGIRLVDAPVSGGVARAVTGELAIFVGGQDDDIDTISDALQPMGTQIFRVGALGSGHAAKALNNLLSAACFSATMEVVRIAESWGIEGDVIAQVLNAATGRNNTTDRKLRQFVLSESYDSGFALTLMVKDLKQSATLAEMAGLDVPLSRQIVESWTAGASMLDATADHTEMARVIAQPLASAVPVPHVPVPAEGEGGATR